MSYIAFPIADRGVPSSAQAIGELLRQLEGKLAAGKSVAVHCRQGIGRSALVAACLLGLAGADLPAAFQRISAARECVVPETPEQRAWVAKFAHDSLAAFRKS